MTHLTNSVVDGDVASAASVLAELAVAHRNRPLSFAEKQAIAGSDVLTSIGSALQQHPHLGSALLGGLGGGAATGLGTAIQNRRRAPGDRKSILGSMLTGGVAGAALGGGASMVGRGMQQLRADRPTTEQLPPGIFPHKGKLMQLDPKALQENPDLANQVSSHQPAASWMTKALAPFGLAYDRMNQVAPTSTNVLLPGMAIADAAMNVPGVNMGDRIGFGRINPRYSTNPEHLSAGLMAKPPEAGAIPQELRDHIVSKVDVKNQLGKEPFYPKNTPSGVPAYSASVPIKPTKDAPDVSRAFQQAEAEQIRNAKAQGVHEIAMARNGGKPGKGITLGRIGSRQFEVPRGLAGGLLRAGLYTGVPVAENLLRNAMNNRQQTRSLESIIEGLRAQGRVQPVPGQE